MPSASKVRCARFQPMAMSLNGSTSLLGTTGVSVLQAE